MFKVNNKDAGTTPMTSLWRVYCELQTYFTPCTRVSTVNFKHVISSWEIAVS